ncbi:MAG TPA: site-specific DNA-methyltransferase [Thermomicrobiales bacterium]|jgi:hypothetical protein|nr:site-specific DNA-methyltransferase [Thermomicrobiales bacterium]
MPDHSPTSAAIRLEWPGRPELIPPEPATDSPALAVLERWPAASPVAASNGDGPTHARDAALFDADASDVLDAWRRTGQLSGIGDRPRLIYLDPPFATGDTFSAVLPIGLRRPGQPAIRLPAYRDAWPEGLAGYLTAMAGLLARAHDLLPGDGWLCVHVDHRASAHLRLLLDELFGADAFRNEIVWSYGLGNATARDRFPRKHDTLLLYAKSPAATFVPVRGEVTAAMDRKYRHVRPDGSRFMRSYGREYDLQGGRPVGSVWNDIPTLSPTGAERTAYPTQKPLALLSRLIEATTAPGDIVLDPCCGSGTTVLAAALAGRTGVGVDRSPLAIATARARLATASIPFTLHMTCPTADALAPQSPVRGGFSGVPPRRYRLDARAAIAGSTVCLTLHHLWVDAADDPASVAAARQRYGLVDGVLVDRRAGKEMPLTATWSDWLDGWAVLAGPDNETISAAAFRTGRSRDLPLELSVPIPEGRELGSVTIRLFDLFGATSDHVVPVTAE